MSIPKKRIALVVGARPNFMKAAPLLKELDRRSDIFETTLIHTGQHYDPIMSDVFFQELGMTVPDIHLAAAGSSHVQTIANIIRKMTDVLSKHTFDAVVVFGDVNSTLASAIATSKQRAKLIHVEAGLRSNDRRMPEEINRVITDHISDILFTSEQSANENLKNEGVLEQKIYFVGNIMIDSLAEYLDQIESLNLYKDLGLTSGEYIMCTIHRQENVDDPKSLKRIFSALNDLTEQETIVIALHPRTKTMLEQHQLSDLLERLTVIEPQSYLNFLNLVKNAKAVITDSGGIQEETTWLNIQCITLRDNTERPATITDGTNTLILSSEKNISEKIKEVLAKSKKRRKDIPNWDSMTANRIADVIEKNV